jgi:phosphopantetheinyl transferase
MGNLPEIEAPLRFPLEIPTLAHFRDHLFEGKPVLPAVEAMETLAREVKHIHPEYEVTQISNARFEKFLFIDRQRNHLPALMDLELLGIGDLHAALVTRTKAPGAAITRTKTHARLIFAQSEPELTPFPLDVAAAPEGICTPVAADRIYRDLVPFGPAYRNLHGTVHLSPDGALAEIQCPSLPATGTANLLGSPFALDAAFHAACVWAQHYQGIVAFPVGIDQRKVFIPTEPGNRYFARIFPKTVSPDLLDFDIWLMDETGDLCEMAKGVQMRDVSGGRLKPPEWITKKNIEDPMGNLRRSCEAIAVVELDAVAPFAGKTLSAIEKERFDKMGGRRRKSFLAARLAVKRLFRRGGGDNWKIPPRDIQTVCADSSKPCCCHQNHPSSFCCSVSHDHRFAVAVLAPGPVGVDVEVIAERALRCSRLYMSDPEQKLVSQSTLGQYEAAVRVWSAKEAVSKATGMDLADAWQRVRLLAVGEVESLVSIDGKGPFTATHASVDGHVFTLFIL